MNLSERMKAARKIAGLTQTELADKVGIAQTAISQLESGKTHRSTYLSQIARACGVSAYWLETGQGEQMLSSSELIQYKNYLDRSELLASLQRLGQDADLDLTSVRNDQAPADDDEVEIPFLREVELSAGSGRTVIEQSATAKLRFGKSSLRAHNVQFDQAVGVIVSGNSMEPVLPDGSTAGVNTGQTTITDGKMYAIKHGGQLRVKVLYRLPGGGIRIRSLNSAEHPDESYTPEEMTENSIEIIGRVFWGASFF